MFPCKLKRCVVIVIAMLAIVGAHAQSVHPAGPFSVQAAAPSDFDGSGTTDVIWDAGTGARWLYLMNGTVIGGIALMPPAAPGWDIAGIGDFNGDGKSDVLWMNTNDRSRYWIYLMDGNSVIGGGGLPPIQGSFASFTDDFNGDGKADILTQDSMGRGWISLMSDASIQSSRGLPATLPLWFLEAVGDFDGNATPDFLWRNAADPAQHWIYLMSAAGDVVGSGGFDVVAGYYVSFVGDFDGDGKADVLWENGTANRWMFFMDGAQISRRQAVPVAAPGWNVAGVGDFNADGRIDLLWTNGANPTQCWIYLLSGATVIGSGGFSVAYGYLPVLP